MRHSPAERPQDDDTASTNSPANAMLARPLGRGNNQYSQTITPLVQLSDQALAPTGGDQPHNNLQPYLTFYFCIALQGVFPPRG